jgi:excisionase family DNA binding protein
MSNLVTVNELAETLNLSRRGVYRLVECRRIPYVRLGGPIRGALRFDLGDVLDHLKQNPEPAVTA